MTPEEKTPEQLKIEAEKEGRLEEYKHEVQSEKELTKESIEHANPLKKPTNH